MRSIDLTDIKILDLVEKIGETLPVRDREDLHRFFHLAVVKKGQKTLGNVDARSRRVIRRGSIAFEQTTHALASLPAAPTQWIGARAWAWTFARAFVDRQITADTITKLGEIIAGKWEHQ